MIVDSGYRDLAPIGAVIPRNPEAGVKSEYSQCNISAPKQRPGSGEGQWYLSLRSGGDPGLALSHAVTGGALPPLLHKPRNSGAVRSGRCVGDRGLAPRIQSSPLTLRRRGEAGQEARCCSEVGGSGFAAVRNLVRWAPWGAQVRGAPALIAGGTRAPERPCCGPGALGTGKNGQFGQGGRSWRVPCETGLRSGEGGVAVSCQEGFR